MELKEIISNNNKNNFYNKSNELFKEKNEIYDDDVNDDNDDCNFDCSEEIETIFYEDEHVLLTNLKLIIKKYYFPLKKSKTILIKNIKLADMIKLSYFNGKYKFFGLNFKLWYFHLDKDRPKKEEGILITLNSVVKPLITPNDINKVLDYLNKLIKLKFT